MIVRVMAKTSGNSTRGVSGYIFCGIQDSFTTQELPAKTATNPACATRFSTATRLMHDRPAELKPTPFPCVKVA